MTKKDYALIAQALKEAQPSWDDYSGEAYDQHCNDCEVVAEALARDNPRFNRERFLKACGVESRNA